MLGTSRLERFDAALWIGTELVEDPFVSQPLGSIPVVGLKRT